MYSPVFVKTENELNKIIRTQKRTNEEIGILFTSLWDEPSQALVAELKNQSNNGKKKLYIVNSFMMPHAFIIYRTTKLPHLIRLRGRTVESYDYLSLVYKELGL